MTDERFDGLIDPDEVHRFAVPKGTVLILDSSRCFHYGSRNPRNRRYHLQYAYVSPVRNDFGDVLRPGLDYPVSPDDPPYRRLALDRDYVNQPPAAVGGLAGVAARLPCPHGWCRRGSEDFASVLIKAAWWSARCSS